MLDAAKPAFPRTGVYEPGADTWGFEDGLNIRAHFSSMFMSAFISNRGNSFAYPDMADQSVMAADALIERLKI